ncbi:MAG: hypothetical protein AB1416_03375 [Actinomycetota bacterium]
MTGRPVLTMFAAVAMAPAAAAAPTLTGGALTPQEWSREAAATARWTQSGMDQAVSPAVTVEVNAAADGTATGAWLTVHADPQPFTSGARSATFPTAQLEGRHFTRVAVRDMSGLVATLPLGTLQVDRTAPTVTAGAARHAPAGSTLAWTEEDAASGVDPDRPAAVEVNSSPAGDAAGAWIPAATPGAGGAGGERSVTVPASLVSPGVHLVRVRSADRAGNETVAGIGVAYSDQTPPTVTDVRVVEAPTAASQSVEVTFRAVDAAPGAGIAAGAAALLTDPSGAAVYWEGSLDEGAEHRVRAHLPGPRDYRLVVRVTDAAGNTGAGAPVDVSSPAPAPGTVTTAAAGTAPSGAASPARRGGAGTPVAHFTVTGGTPVLTGPGRVPARRVLFGRTVTVAGVVRSGAGRLLAATRVQVRDAGGPLGDTATDRHGRFRITVAPVAGGPLRIVIRRRSGEPRAARIVGRNRVVVRPRVRITVSTRRATAGGRPVVVAGRLLPAPRDLPGSPSKRVVLEWRDPLRGEWRPVVDGQASAGGRFRFTWRFGAGGFAVPLRVRVPEELGWPLEPVATPSVTVRVDR